MSHNSNNGVAYTDPDIVPSHFRQSGTCDTLMPSRKNMSPDALLSRIQEHAALITLRRTTELSPELQAIYELAKNS